MVDAFFAALAAGAVYDYCGVAGNPSEDRDLQKLLFSQRSELAGYRHTDAGKIEKRGVITYVDIGFSGDEFFAAAEFISDKSELAEDPTPDVQKEVAYGAKPEKKRQCKPGQEEDHKDRKN